MYPSIYFLTAPKWTEFKLEDDFKFYMKLISCSVCWSRGIPSPHTRACPLTEETHRIRSSNFVISNACHTVDGNEKTPRLPLSMLTVFCLCLANRLQVISQSVCLLPFGHVVPQTPSLSSTSASIHTTVVRTSNLFSRYWYLNHYFYLPTFKDIPFFERFFCLS